MTPYAFVVRLACRQAPDDVPTVIRVHLDASRVPDAERDACEIALRWWLIVGVLSSERRFNDYPLTPCR